MALLTMEVSNVTDEVRSEGLDESFAKHAKSDVD